MEPAALELVDVSLRRAGRAALAGVSLTLTPGSRTALVGAEASGHWALVQVALGIERPSQGQVRLAGRRPGPAARRGVGYVPRDPAWYPHLSCLGVGELLGGLYPGFAADRFRELLLRFGVPPRAPAVDLAPGPQARLALAAALTHAPPLVVVEVDPRLDDVARARLLAALDEELPADATLLLVSERLAGLGERAERLLVLSQGAVRFHGAQADLLARLRRVRVAGAEPPELPAGVRAVGWRRRAGHGELTVEVETPTQLGALAALPGLLDLDLLDLDQAVLALAWPAASTPRSRVAPPPLTPPGLPREAREAPP